MTATQPTTAPARRLRVLVLEPLELVREGIRGALSACDDLSIFSGAGDPFDGARGDGEPPDVVLLGADASRPDGVETVVRVAQRFPMSPVVVLAPDAGLDPFLAAVRAGARGYLLRSVRGLVLADAVRAAAYGGSVVDPLVARRLLEQIASLPVFLGMRSGTAVGAAALRSLSRRESDVLQLLAQGMSNKEIAFALGLRVGTVKTHLRHVFRKLQVADRTSAALAALRPAAAAG